jgi:hypothetical protein
VGGNSIDDIYRVDGPSTFTIVADIGVVHRAPAQNRRRSPERSPLCAAHVPWRAPSF